MRREEQMAEAAPFLSLCAPAYNEAEGIAQVIAAWEETIARLGLDEDDPSLR